jgi:hypothetical protein
MIEKTLAQKSCAGIQETVTFLLNLQHTAFLLKVMYKHEE